LSKPRIKDVAIRAGVSVATVSRVLNNADSVKPETRERVKTAIKEMGYFPNYSARSLRVEKTFGIGLVIPHDVYYTFTFPYFTEFVHGISTCASAEGYHLVLTMSNGNDVEHHADLIKKKIVDGVILFDVLDGDERIKVLKRFGLPFIVVGRPKDVGEYLYVDTDNSYGSYEATKYLLDIGYKRILFLNGPKGQAVSRFRLDGYKLAHIRAGIEIDNALILEGDFTQKSGERLTKYALGSLDFDAIFATSDLTAIGAMNVLKREDIEIGRDISVIGFDDIAAASMVTPKLTTVHQPILDLGRTAASMLIKCLNHEKVKSKLFDVKLIVRDSTKRM